MDNPLLKVLKRQFESSFSMLQELVDNCPDDVWIFADSSIPFWQQIYHASYWLDFWLRDAYDGSEFRSMVFDESITFELKNEITTPTSDLTREQMKEYLMKIHLKTERIFEKLNDALLASPIMENRYDYTFADVIVGQIRHVMYHVGRCNLILSENKSPTVKWIAHNERRQ